MDREERTNTNATARHGARVRTLLSIDSPAEGRPQPRRSLCALWPLCGSSVSSDHGRTSLVGGEAEVLGSRS